MLKALRMRMRALFDRASAEAELNDELRFHIELETEKNVREGLPPQEAARRARIAFGGVENTKETYRDGRGTRGFEELVSDTRQALRALWRDRALSVAGIATLALGIGATTAVFSAVNAVMLRELPFRDPGRLVAVWEENSDRGWYKNVVAPANYLDWRERVPAFAGLAAYTSYNTTVTLLGHGEPQALVANDVSGNFLDVLGVAPAIGRGFDDGDTWDRGQRPILISHRVWQAQFGGDSSVIGKSVNLGGALPWRVVGVLPAGFAFPTVETDLWKPLLLDEASRTMVGFRRGHWLSVVGRLAPGVTTERANAALQMVATQLEAEYPATNTRMGAGITPLHEWIVGDTRTPLLLLLIAAGVLLLIACANVGNLLLVHALGRARDVSLRVALGATRARVARQALTESLVLSIAGGVAGLALGWAGARGLLALQPPGMLPVTDIDIDLRVLMFALGLTTLSGVAFGVAPALLATRSSPAEALASGGRTSTTGSVRRWGRLLVMGEVALAVLLMVGAGLLIRSYDRLSRVPPGFDSEGILTASLNLPAARYDSASKVIGFYATLLERVQALPGVERAAFVRALPVTVASWSSNLAVAGRAPFEQSQDVLHREVLGEYFQTMRVPLLRGRSFAASDVWGSERVVIVNDVLAKQYFANEDPVGQRITFDRVPDSTSVWRTIVGVVGSERQGALVDPPRPEIFVSQRQALTRGMVLVVRVAPGREPSALAQPVRRAVRELDSLLAVVRVRPMTEVHGEAIAMQRFTSTLAFSFAASGVLLALVGVFGVLAQLVQARWREMGIRLALGAQRAQVRWLVARHGATLVAGGIGAGLLVAFASSRFLTSLLYETPPTDVVTFGAVAVLIAAFGMLAAWLPAWRAAQANPAGTLRAE